MYQAYLDAIAPAPAGNGPERAKKAVPAGVVIRSQPTAAGTPTPVMHPRKAIILLNLYPLETVTRVGTAAFWAEVVMSEAVTECAAVGAAWVRAATTVDDCTDAADAAVTEPNIAQSKSAIVEINFMLLTFTVSP